MFSEFWKFLNKSTSINHRKLKLKPLQAFVGLEGKEPVILDFSQANGLKVLATMGGGKSVACETVLESLSRSTHGIQIVVISLSGDTDFKRFAGRKNYEFFNPSYQRDEILARFKELNEVGQQTLKRMSECGVRHAMELKNYRATVVFIDELESCFSVERDAGDDRKVNEQIIAQANNYLRVGRKLANLLMASTQTQTLSSSALALRLMHYTLLGRAQTSAICNELGISDDLGKDPSLKAGKFILIGHRRIKVLRVARFK